MDISTNSGSVMSRLGLIRYISCNLSDSICYTMVFCLMFIASSQEEEARTPCFQGSSCVSSPHDFIEAHRQVPNFPVQHSCSCWKRIQLGGIEGNTLFKILMCLKCNWQRLGTTLVSALEENKHKLYTNNILIPHSEHFTALHVILQVATVFMLQFNLNFLAGCKDP